MKRRFKINSIVRDNRLEIMNCNGLKVDYNVLSEEEYISELNKKLLEEAASLSMHIT